MIETAMRDSARSGRGTGARRTTIERSPTEPGFWNRLLWALVFPRRRQRIMPTLSGVLLIGLSFGIGTAAYNAANNILFITLSLLLACLILSGVLSWLNFRGIDWRLEVAAPWRVGQEGVVSLKLVNGKTVLPTYGLWFELIARVVQRDVSAGPETTFTAKGIDVQAALAAAGKAEAKTELALRTRLDPGGETRLEWIFKPGQRGRLRVELANVGSAFPFGFLRKEFATDLVETVVVWPAPVEYRRLGLAGARRSGGEERVARVGAGTDLLALRRYAAGDSHRLVHWKASARAGRLLVRQFAAESAEGFSLWVRTDEATWSRPEQFELMLGFAGTLAEDLFRTGNLLGLALGDEPPAVVRRVRDVESFLDRLAVVEGPAHGTPLREEVSATGADVRRQVEGAGRKNLITFSPEGLRGVAAWVDGEKLALV